jgi:potassium/hydrogen antiporter
MHAPPRRRMADVWVFLLAGASLVLLGFAAAQAFDRFRFPDFFILMAIGLVLGSGVLRPILPVDPKESLDSIAPILSAVAIAFILFEGGLVLHVRGLGRIWGAAGSHTLVAMALSIVGVLFVGTFFLGLAPTTSIILGIAFCGPSASIDISLLSQLKVTDRTRFTIIVEGVMGNVVAAVFVLLFIQLSGLASNPATILVYLANVGAAVGTAFILGHGWMRVVKKRPRRFAFMTSVAIAVFLYAVGEGLLGGNGGIAAFVFGLVLGHGRALSVETANPQGAPGPRGLQEFHAELVFLLRTFFFLYLGLQVNLTGVSLAVVLGAIAFIAVFLLSRLPSTSALSRTWRLPRTDARILRATVSRGMTDTVLILFAIQVGYIPATEAGFVTALLFMVIVTAALASAVGVFRAEVLAKRAPAPATPGIPGATRLPVGTPLPPDLAANMAEFLSDPIVKRGEID